VCGPKAHYVRVVCAGDGAGQQGGERSGQQGAGGKADNANHAAVVTVPHFRPPIWLWIRYEEAEIIQHGASGAKTKFDLIRRKLITVMLYFHSRNKSVNLSPSVKRHMRQFVELLRRGK
jgi:hypothetical protein